MARRRPDNRSSSREWVASLALLGDSARLRLLRLVAREELGVGELARALQLPQSTVSRHLKPLFEAGWILKRSEGTTSLYRLALDELDEAHRALWQLTRERSDADPASAEDDHRLAAVIAERRGDAKAFFGRIGGEWSQVRRELFGSGFSDEALLGLIDPTWIVADLGCGTGEASERLAPLVSRVIAIDREPAMLDAARKRLGSLRNIDYRVGELERLPLRAASIDAAVAMLVLHHVANARDAVADTARCLKPGGVLLVVDMVAHERAHWRHTMGHRHLGFSDADVKSWDGAGGCALRRLHRLPADPQGKGPGLFAALFQRGVGGETGKRTRSAKRI